MNVRTLCLAILSRGDTTGYEIRKQSVDGRFSHFVDASFGSIYPALARLEADGLVTSRQEAQAGKPDRKIYSISETGRAEFAASLLQPPRQDIFRSEFLLVAMFAELAGPAAVARAIALRTKQIEQERNHLMSISDEKPSASVDWVCRYGIACMEGSLAYLTNNKERLMAIAAGADTLTETPLETSAAE